MSDNAPAAPANVLVYAESPDCYRFGQVVQVTPDGTITWWEDPLGQQHLGKPGHCWIASQARIEEKLGHRIKIDDLADLVMLSGTYPTREAAAAYILNFWRK